MMMTTPENFRRRQRIEGAFLIIIGLFIAGQSFYFASSDSAQRECFEQKFSELSYALDSRSDLTEKETTQNKKLWMIYATAAGLVKDKDKIALTKKQQDKFNRKLVDQLLEYKRVITKIEHERKDNPLPPYPAGTCEKKD